ncbi:Beta-1,4-glucuronyltransferase 1 [Holothuria leucospilota]|uniref:Beta-1,4-glucuronyltransferase 1 n=1 Tax=Holothuria leucospilota TaxID=206669 RepID=A0A9Q1BUN0_HOLLE|nr:Beta-1,4-glucuronyltransferase 1 [Holothuria leucospilota]
MTNEITKITSSGGFFLVFNISVGLILAMQGIHYFYKCGSFDIPLRKIMLSETPEDMELKISLDVERRGEYYVYHVLRTPPNPLPIVNSVTYATECSSHNLRHLPSLVERWNGPVSLAIITSADDFLPTIKAINSLCDCYPAIREHVTFHVVIHEDHASSISLRNIQNSYEVPCNQLIKYLFRNLKGKNFALEGITYPGNVLRNVASSHSTTNFILVADIDLSPSLGFYQQTVRFFKAKVTDETLTKTAFIVPTFEIEEINYLPIDKEDLAVAVENGHARQFHNDTCLHCHKISDYDRWLKLEASMYYVISLSCLAAMLHNINVEGSERYCEATRFETRVNQLASQHSNMSVGNDNQVKKHHGNTCVCRDRRCISRGSLQDKCKGDDRDLKRGKGASSKKKGAAPKGHQPWVGIGVTLKEIEKLGALTSNFESSRRHVIILRTMKDLASSSWVLIC